MFRFGFIGDGLRYVIDAILVVIPNYGWAIIAFTLLIRLVLTPLDVKSKRSMSRMNELKPQMDALSKKYAKDKEKYNLKVQELYRKEKASPTAGCLPMLIQMVILFAMFAIMREVADEYNVRMILDIKEALEGGNLDYKPVLHSWLWIKNVFQPDSFMAGILPAANDGLAAIGATANLTEAMLTEAREFLATDVYATWAAANGNTIMYSAPMLLWTITIPEVWNGLFLLPVIACVSQFVSTKLTGTMGGEIGQTVQTGKPDNNKMMKYLFPIISLFFCATSNASFAIYWVAANLIQIAQQFLIGKWITYSDNKKKLVEEAAKP